MKDKIKRWYDLGLWTKEQVHEAVPKLITPEDYEEITGEPYEQEDFMPTIDNITKMYLGDTLISSGGGTENLMFDQPYAQPKVGH